MSSDAPLKLYTLKELAKIFRVSPRKMQDVHNEHPVGGRLGRRWLFTEANILELWERLQRSRSEPPKPPKTTKRASPSTTSWFAKAEELLRNEPRHRKYCAAKAHCSTKKLPIKKPPKDAKCKKPPDDGK